jgi:hypothetical protein
MTLLKNPGSLPDSGGRCWQRPGSRKRLPSSYRRIIPFSAESIYDLMTWGNEKGVLLERRVFGKIPIDGSQQTSG